MWPTLRSVCAKRQSDCQASMSPESDVALLCLFAVQKYICGLEVM